MNMFAAQYAAWPELPMTSTEEPKRMKKSRLLSGKSSSRKRLPSTLGLRTVCISLKLILERRVSLRTIAAFATPAIGGRVDVICLWVASNESLFETSLEWSV